MKLRDSSKYDNLQMKAALGGFCVSMCMLTDETLMVETETKDFGIEMVKLEDENTVVEALPLVEKVNNFSSLLCSVHDTPSGTEVKYT